MARRRERDMGRGGRRLTLRTQVLVGFIVLVVLVATAVVLVAATVHGRDQGRVSLTSNLRPAQSALSDLTQSLLEQEDSLHAYQLTGQLADLAPYVAGFATQGDLDKQLTSELKDYPAATAKLKAVDKALNVWVTRAALPGLKARAAGPVNPVLEVANENLSKELLGAARVKLQGLVQLVNQAEVQVSTAATNDSNDLTIIVWVMLAMALVVSLMVGLAQRYLITRPLEIVSRSVARASAGNLEESIPEVGPPEISDMAAAVEQMRLRLLSQAEETLQRSLIVAQDDERRRIAQDIHDDSVQSLVAINLRLQRLANRLSDPKSLAMVEAAATTTSGAIDRLRQLMFDLYPTNLESEGLDAALRALLTELLSSEGITWEIVGGPLQEPSRPVQVLAYRLTREAVVNVAKHAEASNVEVSIENRQGGVAISVRDDGEGFDPTKVTALPGHLGQSTLAGLALAVGGWEELVSTPGEGTTVTFWLPDLPVSGAG